MRCGWRGGAVVSTITSQQEESNLPLCGVHALLGAGSHQVLWFPQSCKIGLIVSVGVSGCLSL